MPTPPPETERPLLERIDESVDRFESQLKSGGNPLIESFLEGWQDPELSKLLVELVGVEQEFRVHRGEKPSLSEYHNRFPHHQDAIDKEFPASLGNYDLLELVGLGAFGRVYRARLKGTNIYHALKILHERKDSADLDLVVKEFQALAKIKHPAIVTAHTLDIGLSGSSPYLAMEYVEGKSLQEVLKSGRLPVGRVVRLVSEIAQALGAAHAAGIIHRDLKPANILIDLEWQPHLTDFGLALLNVHRHDKSEELAGTLAYIPPEYTRSEVADPRSDIWSLGVIFYEMLTGETPFHGETRGVLFDKIQNEQPTEPRVLRPDLSPKLQQVCLRCLEKDRSRRWSTAHDLAAALQHPSHPNRVPRVNKLAASLFATAALIVLSVLIGFHFSHSSGRSDKDIRAAIESDLRKDPVLHYADLSTMVKDGAVTLTGEVHGDLDRTRAAAVAAREDGVRQVTNDLRVALPIVEGNAKVHASRSDDDILRAIESILQNDPVLQYAEVRVAVEAGDVTLAGEVHEDSDRIRAANIATRQVGVRHVINKLQLPELIADNKGASRLPARTPAMAPAGSAFGSHGGVGGQRSVPAPQSPSGPQAGVPAPQIPSGPQTEKVFLRDDFTSDRFLNDFQWVTSGEVLNARILKADTRFVPVQLAFTSSGMVMAGVNGKYQSTGIQSKRSFSAPLTLSATVMGTISNGNPIAFYLVSADGAQYLAVNCNLAGRNDSYSGASFGFTGRGDSGNQKSEAFLHEVSVRTWYLIRFVIDEGGTGTVTIQDRQGTLLAQRGNLYVGTGPFFVVLAQWAGWPHTVGPNEAVWASVLLSVPQSAKSSSRSHEQR